MILKLEGIEKSFQKKKVLAGVELTAKSGECIGILGGNGSGKSTLLSILAGVQKADAGKFLVDGQNLFQTPQKRTELLGYVPQQDPLIEELNGWDNLRLWYDRESLEKSLSDGMLAELGIGEFLKTPVRKMSGGMKKRLSIGCAIASNPGILLLDEPSSALDLVCKETIYRYFERFKAEGGILLLATHDMQEMTLCNHHFILKKGKLSDYAFDGDLHHLVEHL